MNKKVLSDPSRRQLISAAAIIAAAGVEKPVYAAADKQASAATISPRIFPPPLSISEAAQKALRAGADFPRIPTPTIDDIPGWKSNIAMINSFMDGIVEPLANDLRIRLKEKVLGGVTTFEVTKVDASKAEKRKAHLYLHGGAWIYGSGRRVIIPAVLNALHFGGVVYAPDFRLPPDHPFPAAIDDCHSVYRALLDKFKPGAILVSGESSGGNIAAGLMHKIRDAGLQRPSLLFLNSPVTDLSGVSDTLVTNLGLDVVLGNGVGAAPQLYLGNQDPKHPYVSPLNGKLSDAFPKTYLRTGTRDLLLSDAVRLHAALRKVEIDADLYVGEGMPHIGFSMFAGGDTPEDIEARADTQRWLARNWTASA